MSFYCDMSADANSRVRNVVDMCASAEQMASKKKQRMAQLIQKSMGFLACEPSIEGMQQTHYGTLNNSATRGDRVIDSASTPLQEQRNGDSAAGDEEPTSTDKRSAVRKQYWTDAEDAKLRALVQQHGHSQWAAIAAHFPNRDRKRCRERFVNHVDPRLQRNEWKRHEDEQLIELHQQLGNHWTSIAQNLPGRSPEDVKNRFLTLAARQMAKTSTSGTTESTSSTSKSARAAPNRWIKADSDTLRALVQAHGASNWLFIASQLPGRTDLQCMQHWYQVLDPSIVKGKGTWTSQEDTILQTKVSELGPRWTEIAQFLPGRVGKQCRERYLNHLDPALGKDPWTPEEEEKLAQACA
uniref:Myb-like DNA-binding protein n=1 Tax=Globisporangium ultimum (strain ATCC 200006 / CBS 805.95 / DAOM BR144) TaxID=431595 RepID=K3W5C7_GLOUD